MARIKVGVTAHRRHKKNLKNWLKAIAVLNICCSKKLMKLL